VEEETMVTKLLLLFLAVFGVAFARVTMTVTVNVFSGTEDPSWTISKPESEILSQLLANKEPEYRPWPEHSLGYSGITVHTYESIGQGRPIIHRAHVVYGNQDLEYALLLTAPEGVVPASVMRHINSHIVHRPLTAPARQNVAAASQPNPTCKVPIVGPDNETVYSPSTDDCGYFVSHCSENNCYAYGTDIVTDTFPQPGRGSGHKWDKNTCDDMRAAAERDGLVWVGTDLPTKDPEVGHYVSLHIWANTNFHWLRKDTNLPTHWSHKPGSTPVRDVDNNGKKITDPSKADISPWSIFCGYMLVIPSKVTIN